MRLSAIQAAQRHLKDNAYLSDFIKSHDIETFPPIAILKTPQARHRPCLILNIKRDLHHAHYRFTCANPLDDGNNAKSLLKMAKATLQQLMHEAFAKDT